MGKILLEGMKFYAHHGYYEEEQVLGNHFIVDISVETDTNAAANADDITAAFNYENIHWVAKFEMSKTTQLLENVGHRIVSSLKEKFDDIKAVNVRVSKENPPLGGRVARSFVETSGKIGLEGLEFHAPIGFSEEERILGNDFVVDVVVETDINTAAATDDLQATINYESLFLVAKTEFNKPARLLENVAHRIVISLKSRYANLKTLRLVIRKKNPAVVGEVPDAKVELSVDHQTTCGRCKRSMLCYNSSNCWCHDIPVFSANQKLISASYSGCLCKNCLSLYAG